MLMAIENVIFSEPEEAFLLKRNKLVRPYKDLGKETSGKFIIIIWLWAK